MAPGFEFSGEIFDGEATAASTGGVVFGMLGWWICLVGDVIEGRSLVVLSSAEIDGGRMGLWDSFWVLTVPQSWIVGGTHALGAGVGVLAFILCDCAGLRWVAVRRVWGDGCPPTRLMVWLWRWSDRGCNGGVTVRVVKLWVWAWLVGLWFLLHSLTENWAWSLSVGNCSFFHVLCYLYFLAVGGFRPVISLYQLLVGLGELCLGLCTLCALSALVRRCALVKWSQPPSGRMKHRATRSPGWLHSEKAELIGKLWLCFSIIFLVCRLYCKAAGIAYDANPAIWRLFEYMFLEESPAIIARHSLEAYCFLGFRHYVPPMYSVVSLLKV